MRWLRSLDPQLPREVWLLQLGGVMNSFGNGFVLPFLVIYLHDVRGFGLGISGLVVAVSAAAQLSAGIVAGPLVDRLGPRNVLGAGLVLQSVGFGLFPLVRSPWAHCGRHGVQRAVVVGNFFGETRVRAIGGMIQARTPRRSR